MQDAAFFNESEARMDRVRMLMDRRPKRTSAHSIFCVLVKQSRHWSEKYRIRADANGLPLGAGESADLFPGSFLTEDCHDILDPTGVSVVNIEILDPRSNVVLRESMSIPNEGVSKSSLTLGMTHEEGVEHIEIDIYHGKTDLSASGEYSDHSVIGHRGCGMDGLDTTDMRENTVSSFQEAYRRGARWVELDVQLTEDRVPVVYHDFAIGGDCMRIDRIAAEEFLQRVGNPQEDDPALPCTFAKMLASVDEDLGLNVEIKYPNPGYVEEHGYRMSPEDTVEEVVRAVLRSGRRKVFFSSFHPGILFLLKMRLPNFSIYLLTEAQDNPNPYISSLYGALYFCTKLGLDGVVIDWDHMGGSPADVVRAFREYNLKTIVYGRGVNTLDNVQILRDAGAHGVIPDHIQGVCGLN